MLNKKTDENNQLTKEEKLKQKELNRQLKKEKKLKQREIERQQEKEEDLLEKERERIYKETVKYQNEHKKEEKIAPADSFISLQHINKIYGNRVQAVFDFDLEINQHEFIVFVGPSGCGKSTTLRMIAGLEAITSGDLYIDGVYSNDLEPKDRNISMVFQNYALYPHMSVYNNMAFGLKMRKVPKQEIDEKVHKVAKILQLEEYLDRKPKALSGGQCQRVALGRAIVRDSKVFLMDEPLSNLDAKLRVQMRSEIVNLHETLGATTIYVTHDQTEAMTMANRIVVMNKGRIQQVGSPREVYNHPANVFVAKFIGSPAMNILNAGYDHGTITLKNNTKFDLGRKVDKTVNNFYVDQIEKLNLEIRDIESRMNSIEGIEKEHLGEKISSIKERINKYQGYIKNNKFDVLLGIRPENINKVGLSTDAVRLSDPMNVEVIVAELLGQEYFIHSKIGDERIISKVSSITTINNHDLIDLCFDLDHVHLFDADSELLII